MISGLTQARDEIYTMLTTAWNSGTTAIFGYVPELRYYGTPEGPLPDASQAWGRITVRHATGHQKSLGTGNRRFERAGIVMAQCFVPMGASPGLSQSEQLATICRNALEGQQSPGGIWFRVVRVEDIGEDGPWWNTNVNATFIYDEVK